MNVVPQSAHPTHPTGYWNIERVRRDFPLLGRRLTDGNELAYLDNAATTQKPRAVIAAVEQYYRQENANVHRGVYRLAERATAAYEQARELVREYINAAEAHEIVFLRGTTEAINLVASSFAQRFNPGDEVVITTMEHHANIVPWQMLREQRGIVLRVWPISPSGELDLYRLEGLLNERTRLLALTHISNVLGTINPIGQIIQLAHRHEIPVLIDGAQAVPHLPVDVQALDCDFYCFSGHKLFGPTGIGVLYGKERWLESMPPYQTGGEMIRSVSFEQTTFAELPYKFEAGTPHIAGAIGLSAAIDYLNALDQEVAARYELELLGYARARLHEIPGLRLLGEAPHKAPVISFVIDDIHAHDLGTVLDERGIAIRVGHHCAMPLMTFYGVAAAARASLAFYNTTDEIDRLVEGLHYAREILT
ncbi:MAG: cysteine desulfurase [Pseudomonadota bacterium]